jgi:hypothetical protein
MEINAINKVKAFKEVTNKTLKAYKGIIYNLSVNFNFDKFEQNITFDNNFDKAFEGITGWKRGKKVPFREWLIESGFPFNLYMENNCNLSKLIQDKRTWDVKYQGRNQNHNFFGRMCKPIKLKNGKEKSYMEYLLERLKRKDLRSQPHFYFDIAPMSWVWEELMRNENQIRTSKAAVICCTNFWVRWDKKYDKPRFGWIFKFAKWTHLYEDIFCLALIGSAIAKELNISGPFKANVFFVNFTMDDKERAKQLLRLN